MTNGMIIYPCGCRIEDFSILKLNEDGGAGGNARYMTICKDHLETFESTYGDINLLRRNRRFAFPSS